MTFCLRSQRCTGFPALILLFLSFCLSTDLSVFASFVRFRAFDLWLFRWLSFVCLLFGVFFHSSYSFISFVCSFPLFLILFHSFLLCLLTFFCLFSFLFCLFSQMFLCFCLSFLALVVKFPLFTFICLFVCLFFQTFSINY